MSHTLFHDFFLTQLIFFSKFNIFEIFFQEHSNILDQDQALYNKNISTPQQHFIRVCSVVPRARHCRILAILLSMSLKIAPSVGLRAPQGGGGTLIFSYICTKARAIFWGSIF